MNDKKGGWITLKDGRRIYVNDYMSDKIRSKAKKGKEKKINTNSNLKIHTYSTDAYSGQVNMVKEIRDNKDNAIAKLNYADYEGKAYIDFVETNKEYRRQGLATKLFDDLKKEYKDNIEYGYSTPDGTKFLNSYLNKKKNKGGK